MTAQLDLSGVESLIPPIAQALGIEPSTALLGLGIIVTAANVAGRLIPDDATGWLGTVRTIAKTIGFYFPNRITSGVTVNDVAREVIGTATGAAGPVVVDLAKSQGALIPEVINETVEEAREIVEDPFGKAAARVVRELDEGRPDER